MGRPSAHRIHNKRVFGTVYDFKAGDVLAVHTHDETNNHDTIIGVGALEVLGNNNRSGETVEQGEYFQWTAGESHGFRAITDARIFNLLTHDRNINGDV